MPPPPAAAPPATSSYLLSLPPEIRLKIYVELFRGETLELLNWIPPGARRRWEEYLGVAAVVAVNRLCRDEALPVLRQLCTIQMDDGMRLLPQLRNRAAGGLFDPAHLRRVHCDFLPFQPAVPLLEFARTFPRLRVLGFRCFVVDRFNWHGYGVSTGALRTSAELRRKMLGGIVAGDSCVADAIRWARRSWETDAGEMDAWPAQVVVRMRLCARLAKQPHFWEDVGVSFSHSLC